MLENKNVVLGITGCIAAYKSASLISLLRKEGANVKVIMTKNSQQFITPLTIRTLSKNSVVTDMFEGVTNYDVEHISLASKADVFLIAPATANIIGKVANGIADDMLSTTIMATKAPVIFSPAMNNNMYENSIVKANIKKLKKYGYYFIEPKVGMLACGVEAIGKFPDVKDIVDYLKKIIKECKYEK